MPGQPEEDEELEELDEPAAQQEVYSYSRSLMGVPSLPCWTLWVRDGLKAVLFELGDQFPRPPGI